MIPDPRHGRERDRLRLGRAHRVVQPRERLGDGRAERDHAVVPQQERARHRAGHCRHRFAVAADAVATVAVAAVGGAVGGATRGGRGGAAESAADTSARYARSHVKPVNGSVAIGGGG